MKKRLLLHLLLFLEVSTCVFCIDYLKETQKLANEYEETYRHKLTPVDVDEVYNKALKTLSFASCHSVRLAKKEGITIWDHILKYNPDLFLWLGDAAYHRETCCDDIKEGYDKMLEYEPYRRFIQSGIKIDGVYDDHDYGINDGDSTFHCREYSKEYFLDFLNKPKDHYRRNRDGVYFSQEYRDPENPNDIIKIIMLDVRYNKAPYVSEFNNKIIDSFFLQFFRRAFNSIFNICCSYDGDFLGENQWRWLEGQLVNSKATSHIIVSSIQIYNKSDYQESWKLLPYAQKRLTSLLFKTQPKGLILLSGDVHYALVEGDNNLYEITSSGMTHAFNNYLRWYSIFNRMLVIATNDNPYLYNNFGVIFFDYKDVLEATYLIVRDNGDEAIKLTQKFDETVDPYHNLSPKNHLCMYFQGCYTKVKPLQIIVICIIWLVFIVFYKITNKMYQKIKIYKHLYKKD